MDFWCMFSFNRRYQTIEIRYLRSKIIQYQLIKIFYSDNLQCLEFTDICEIVQSVEIVIFRKLWFGNMWCVENIYTVEKMYIKYIWVKYWVCTLHTVYQQYIYIHRVCKNMVRTHTTMRYFLICIWYSFYSIIRKRCWFMSYIKLVEYFYFSCDYYSILLWWFQGDIYDIGFKF